LDPEEDLKSRALQWLHQQPADGHLRLKKRLLSIFPSGPRVSDDQLDIIVADTEGMSYSALLPYLTDFVSVVELVEGLGDPDDAYKRKVKKGAHCVDIS
jgi:hypothetical protein